MDIKLITSPDITYGIYFKLKEKTFNKDSSVLKMFFKKISSSFVCHRAGGESKARTKTLSTNGQIFVKDL